ncbi:MAG: malonic semialdehyde reductase [Gemmobacter sp.]
MSAIDRSALDQLFDAARSHPTFETRPVPRPVLRELVRLTMLGPTAFNQQPLRVVFVESAEAKARLSPALSRGNHDKTMAAPVTAILCWDLNFTDHLPEIWPPEDVRKYYPTEEARRNSARRNATIEAGYFILAARSLGLGCGPMAGFDAARVQQEFLEGTGWEVNFLVNLGWPDRWPDSPRKPRLGFDEVAQLL